MNPAFQKTFFQKKVNYDFSDLNWFTGIEFVLNSKQLHQKTILKRNGEIKKAKSIIKLLLQEFGNDDYRDNRNISSLMVLLLNITIRNILSNNTETVKDYRNPKIQNILNHIHLNICDNKELTVAKLAEKFHISKNYFSEYFLSETGIKLKQYTLRYKVKSAQNKLNYTNLNLSQIAFDLGFSDLSHFNKTYKKIMGIYPREERDSM